MPRRHFLLPPYSESPEFLPWHHCRLCFAVLDGSSEQAYARSLAEHSQQVHGLDIKEFRQRILETVMADFPTPVTAQTHRSLLQRFRAELSEENFTFAGCACCALPHPRSSLTVALFPFLDCESLPQWLRHEQWDDEDWSSKGKLWLRAIAECFNVERYLRVHFHADERLDNASKKS